MSTVAHPGLVQAESERHPLRVAFLVPFLTSTGGIRVILEFAGRLESHGICANVALLEPPCNPIGRTRVRRICRDILHKSGLRSASPWFRGRYPLHSISTVREGTDLGAYDVVVASTWYTARWLHEARGVRGTKAYFVQHHETLWADDREAAEATYGYPLRKVAVSQWLVELMEHAFDQPCLKVRPGIDLLDVPPATAATRGTDPGCRLLLMHHTVPAKRFDDGWRAIRTAGNACSDTDYRVFGMGPCPDDVDAAHYVRCPSRSQLIALYDWANVFVWPSDKEGLGLPPMEAMSRACTVVTRPNGGSREFCRGGETALQTRDSTQEALNETVLLACSNAALRDRIGTQARLFARRHFQWSDAARDMSAFLRSCACEDKKGSSTQAP